MCFGKRLEEIRKERNIKQQELADYVGTSQQTISNYENGINKPSVELLLKIIDVLDVSCDYLLRGTIGCSELTLDQEELLILYNEIPKDRKQHAKEVLKTFIENKNEDKNE